MELLIFFLAFLNISVWGLHQQNPTYPCGDNYAQSKCVQLTMAELIPVLAVPRKVDIWPGMSVVSGGFETPVKDNIQVYLVQGMRSFLGSLRLQVKILDKDLRNVLNNLTRSFVDKEQDEQGRGRKRRQNGLVMGGLLTGGTILSMSMMVVSSVATKALILSFLSMGLILLNRINGATPVFSPSQSKVTYDVIHALPQEDPHWSDSPHTSFQIIKAR